MDTTLLVIVAIWLICAVGAYLIAASKQAPDPGMWGVAGFLLGPIGLVGAAVAAKPGKFAEGRVCARCGKTVARDRERLCNHCGEPFAA